MFAFTFCRTSSLYRKTCYLQSRRSFYSTTIARTSPSLSVSLASSPHKGSTLVQFVTEESTQKFKTVWSEEMYTDFKGTEGQALVQYTSGEHEKPASRLLWVGLGKESKTNLHTLRKVTAKVVEKLQDLKLKDATIALDLDHLVEINKDLNSESVVQTVSNIIVQSSYEFDRHVTREDQRKSKLENVQLTIKGEGSEVLLQKLGHSAHEGALMALATTYARDLANERADVCNPEWMENEARKLVTQYPSLFSIEVLQIDDLNKHGLNLFAAVGKGSAVPPRLVILRYCGNPESDKNEIALVGKGITFDTGGLNIKPTNSIEDMYLDMSGSAAVLATLATLPKLDIHQNIVGVLCLAENAVSENAYHPSSIIKSYKGLTVEIGNTDAEGRLVLADGLTYVQKHYKPSYVVDLATLTGACVVALGEYASGLFTNDNQLRDELCASGDAVFERTWPLPLYSEFSADIKGAHSDIKNTGKSRYGGASVAAAFLKEFIEEGVKWAHIDIAGPAMTSEKRGHIPKGGTGNGTQLLLHWIKNKYSK